MLTVVEEVHVETEIKGVIQKNPRVEQLWDGLLWRLARNPNMGIALNAPNNLYAFKTHPNNIQLSMGVVLIIYQVNIQEGKVYIVRFKWYPG